jgi:hypothetical protein
MAHRHRHEVIGAEAFIERYPEVVFGARENMALYMTHKINLMKLALLMVPTIVICAGIGVAVGVSTKNPMLGVGVAAGGITLIGVVVALLALVFK